MPIKMYDLAGAESDRRFSPFCWRTRFALAHKELDVETIPWRYGDKALLAFANWERVPVIVDQGRSVVDSWAIASYLESAYPARPSLFEGPGGLGLARFYNAWADAVLNPALTRFVMLDAYNHLAPADQPGDHPDALIELDHDRAVGHAVGELRHHRLRGGSPGEELAAA